MKRHSLFSGSRKRNVPASNCAQSEPNAFADMQRTSARECSSPSSIFAGMLSPGLSLPLVEPHPQPVLPQPLRDGAHDRLVFGTMVEEDVEGEPVVHERQSRCQRLTSDQMVCRNGSAPRRRQFSRLELKAMGRPEVYPTNSTFANTLHSDYILMPPLHPRWCQSYRSGSGQRKTRRARRAD